jgi:hypothetical protein
MYVVFGEEGVNVFDRWHITTLQLGELKVIIDVNFKSTGLQ